MLSDEENKVIEYFKRRISNKKTAYTSIYFKIEKLDVLINLIEKQSKEIEELKDRNKELNEALDEWINGERTSIFNIHKDKIKAKIEESENKIKKIRSKKLINEPEDTIIITRYAHYISDLQSLLEKE